MDERNCDNCGNGFVPNSGVQRYCRQEKQRECPVCENSYTVVCAKPRSMAKTCGETCQHLLAERTRQFLRSSGGYAPMASGYIIIDRKFENRVCRTCGSIFEPTSANQKDCLRSVISSCESCDEDFKAECSQAPNRCCGPSCAARLTPAYQGSDRICVKCGDSFKPKAIKQLYCNHEITVSCVYCGDDFISHCSREEKRSYCSATCRAKHQHSLGRSKSYIAKICEICGEDYVAGNTKSRKCPKSHQVPCGFCGEAVELRLSNFISDKPTFCDRTCSNFHRQGSTFPLNRLSEYKDIDGWAISFENTYRRKPTSVDVQIYFGTIIPVRANFLLFKIDGRSGFELHIYDYIIENWPANTILRNKRPLRSVDQRRLEIDIWLPELNLGFEIQDFATHSRVHNDEKSPLAHVELKSGPGYHSAKREAARRVGIELVEIWEDEILDGSYCSKVVIAIEEARQRVLGS